ncbi:hypothetical protein TRFO_10238 [Tritrichomonas foetus]|uniref:Uncharacterized protein n=1 Tax=Tritrichomonas foetus TaxID=1144522 RepID=A0A1J4JFQ2_9EUKA|nr:hypothetical protein TRFO_10238 [Tritrichomonas foetus]|eukprot:OHS96052.1 hypothetical protein TRFO_10238 [Tritrichomonas foetus]
MVIYLTIEYVYGRVNFLNNLQKAEMQFENLKNEKDDSFQPLNLIPPDVKKLFQTEEEKEKFISYIFTDDINLQKLSVQYFSYYMKYNDIILPFDYLNRVLYLFSEITQTSNEEFLHLLIVLFRRCSGFESPMQDYLIKQNIQNLILPFFPHKNVLVILGNLSINSLTFRRNLLNHDIIDNILPLVNLDNSDFDEAVTLLNSLVFYLPDFDFSDFVDSFIAAFCYLHSLYDDALIEKCEVIIKAFGDYVYSDKRFLDNFLQNEQLDIFISKDLNSNTVYENILDICISIVDVHYDVGTNYLVSKGILDWLGSQLLSDSLAVLRNCYQLLFEMLKNVQELADEYIKSIFLIQAIDRIRNPITYKLKIEIYKFICLTFSSASTSQVEDMLNEHVFDVIASNVRLFDDNQENWSLILNAILKLQPMMYHPSVKQALQKLEYNDEFYEWFQEDLREFADEKLSDEIDMVCDLLLQNESDDPDIDSN